MSVTVGLDISKQKFDVFVTTVNIHAIFTRDLVGISKFIKFLAEFDVKRIVIEATGGYERLVARTLAKINLPVVVINARHIKSFSRALGRLAKTDKLDCQVIAEYGEKMEPELRAIRLEGLEALSEAVSRRTQLSDAMVAEKNRLDKCSNKAVLKSINKHIRWLEKEIKAQEAVIKEQIDSNLEWQQLAKRLQTVPGVGSTLTSVLISNLSELGSISNKEIASLVGVAPMNNDSGSYHGKRSTGGGGRKHVRRAVYMSTLSALTYNPAIKEYFQRLKENGKPGKVAVVACMRKLLVLINSMVKSGKTWQDFYRKA